MQEIGTGRTRPTRPWFIAAAVLVTANPVGVALSAVLLVHAPLGLIALSPIGRHFLLAAPVTPLVPFLIVAATRRAASSLVAYKFGTFYGQRAIELIEARSGRIGRLLRAFERLFLRAELLLSFLLPRASSWVAGPARMDLRRFMIASTAGHTFWAAATYMLGDYLSEYIKPVLAFVESNMLAVSMGMIALAVIQLMVRRLRRSRGGLLPGS